MYTTYYYTFLVNVDPSTATKPKLRHENCGPCYVSLFLRDYDKCYISHKMSSVFVSLSGY